MPPTADDAIETFNTATEENQLSPLREQQVVHLPAEGDVWRMFFGLPPPPDFSHLEWYFVIPRVLDRSYHYTTCPYAGVFALRMVEIR